MNRIHLLRWTAVGLVSVLLPCRAEVTLDGTMGASGPLSGPDFVIPDTVGQARGTNLFHSFSTFNINSGENATFTGPAVIDNVISRVTGGSQSFIDGLLRSAIESANLWFINPSGVLFGPNASLDVDGSFHVSTADYLKLKDGVRFNAKPSANDALLTTAPPEAFGFLGKNPAPFTFTESRLSVREGKTLSVVGGDIKLTGGALSAPSGRINIASVDATGEITIGETDLDASGFERRGNIRISGFGTIDTSGEGGGAIFIRGGEFVVDGGLILAETLGNKDGVGINVKTDSLSVTGGALNATTFGSGKGGDLTVQADSILLSGFACLFGISCLSVGANTVSTGDAGNLSIMAGSLDVRDGAVVDASTFGSGHGGDLLVEADRIFLSGGGLGLFTAIAADSFSTGDAGDLTVKAGSLEVRNGAAITASTFSSGRGGNLTIEASDVELADNGGISAASFGAGESGAISIKALDNLRLFNDSHISVATTQADAGDINLNVGNLLHLRDGSSITTSVAGGTGDGGNITIDPVFTVLEGASEVVARARKGSGGNIRITTDFLFRSPDSRIDASSEFGVSGTVEIDSPDTDITGGITTLPESFFDAAALLRERCGVRAAVGRSSFVVRGRGLPAAPDTYLSASYFEVPESGQAQPVSVTENSTGFGLDFSSMAAGFFGGFELGCRSW